MRSKAGSVGILALQGWEDVKKRGHPAHPLYLPQSLTPRSVGVSSP